MSMLPTGWISATIPEVADVLDSLRVPLNANERAAKVHGKISSELVPYFGATGQVGYTDSYLFNEDLVLLGEDGVPFFDLFKKKAYRISGKSWVNNHAHVLRAISGVMDWRLLEAQLNGLNYVGHVSGSTRLKLTQAAMNKLPILVPPQKEQRRIADKLDTILTRVDALNDRLARITPLLKRFRQSVLAAATSGRLTEDWRGERAPVEWQLHSVNSLCHAVNDGPFGSNLKSADYTNDGARVVRLENIGHLTFDKSKQTFISTAKYAQLSKYAVDPGDLLFSSFVDEDVRVCEFPVVIRELAINKADCFRLKVDESRVVRRFLMYRLASRSTYQELKELVHGATRPRINLSQLKAFKVAVPSIEEQTEIVRRVEILFAYADRLEARLQTARTAAERLTPALLAKAFRGELVPQDPNDEPAAELLRRLREARAAAPTPSRRGRKSAG